MWVLWMLFLKLETIVFDISRLKREADEFQADFWAPLVHIHLVACLIIVDPLIDELIWTLFGDENDEVIWTLIFDAPFDQSNFAFNRF